MPTAAFVPADLLDAPFRGSAAVRDGVLSRRQLESRAWRRLFHDVYVHLDVPVTRELRARAAAVLLPAAVITGRSAAVLWGVDLAGTDDDVEVTLPPATNQVRVTGLTTRRPALTPNVVRQRRGVPVTTPEATAVRLASALPQDDAVAAVDQLVATGVVELEPIRAMAATIRGPGSARAREVASLATGSPSRRRRRGCGC